MGINKFLLLTVVFMPFVEVLAEGSDKLAVARAEATPQLRVSRRMTRAIPDVNYCSGITYCEQGQSCCGAFSCCFSGQECCPDGNGCCSSARECCGEYCCIMGKCCGEECCNYEDTCTKNGRCRNRDALDRYVP